MRKFITILVCIIKIYGRSTRVNCGTNTTRKYGKEREKKLSLYSTTPVDVRRKVTRASTSFISYNRW